jgi:hypothetical protein
MAAPLYFDPNEEVLLYGSRKEKEDIEELGDLYGIIKATDLLEAAYTRGHVSAGKFPHPGFVRFDVA